MSFEVLFLSILAVAAVVVMPVVLIWSTVDYLRGRGSDRQGGGGHTAGIGAALQELDRLVARPAIEYKIETEHHVQDVDDDKGGD